MIKIRKLLFPTTIYGYRLFSERFLGIYIGESFVKATVTKNTGSKKIIEKLIEIDFPSQVILDSDGNIDVETLTEALTKVYKQAGTVDKIFFSLPANLFVFKDLEMPFNEDEKINMVLNYEAEPLLPFPAENCVLDFIKSPTNTIHSCKIMLCSIQKTLLNSLNLAVEKTKIKPDNITIDLVTLYDLCSQTEAYQENRYAIISIAESWTKIGLVDGGLLRFVKNIPIGTNTILEKLCSSSNITPELAYKLLTSELEVALEDEPTQQLQKITMGLCKKVQFAIQSLNSKTDSPAMVNKILVFEEKTPLPGFFKLCQQQMNIVCQPFSVDNMLTQGKIINRASYKASSIYFNLMALASSTTSPEFENFDLGRNIVSTSQQTLIKQQALSTCIIVFLIFLYIFGSASIKNQQINSTITGIEQLIRDEATKLLLTSEIKLPKTANVKKLLDEADGYVERLKQSWQTHGNDDLKPLEAMLDLTRLMDHTKIDIKITQLKMFCDQDCKKILEFQGSFPKNTANADFKKLTSQLLGLKKFSNIKIKEEQLPDIVQFSIQANLEQ